MSGDCRWGMAPNWGAIQVGSRPGEGAYRGGGRPQVCQPPRHPFEMRWGGRPGRNGVGRGPKRRRTAATGRQLSTSFCGQAAEGGKRKGASQTMQ